MKPQICTTVEQSKKLAEILPIESVDMHYMHTEFQHQKVDILKLGPALEGDICETPAWSLATLLEFLPSQITDDEGDDYFLKIYKEDEQYYLIYTYEESPDIKTSSYDSLIDACYEMILMLKEKNLL